MPRAAVVRSHHPQVSTFAPRSSRRSRPRRRAVTTSRRSTSSAPWPEPRIRRAKDPTSIAFARREYAETLITWGEYPAAIQHLEIALGARGEDPVAWRYLGFLKHNRGDSPGAILAFEKSRDLSPKDFVIRRDLAVLRWKTGDRAGAAEEYRKMLELELPARLRDKVEWALRELAKP